MSVEGHHPEKSFQEHEAMYYESLERLKESQAIELISDLGAFLGLDVSVQVEFDPQVPELLPSVSLYGTKTTKQLAPQLSGFRDEMSEVEEESSRVIQVQAPVHKQGKIEITPLLQTTKKYTSSKNRVRTVVSTSRGNGRYLFTTAPTKVGEAIMTMATEKGFIQEEKRAEAQVLLSR